MKDLKKYIKEGLFDDLDKLDGKSGLDVQDKQLKKDIIDWICLNYYTDLYCAKSKLLKKRSVKVDTSTSPPTVTITSPFPIYFKWGKNLNNNGMFQWGNMSDSFVSLSPVLNTLDGAPKKVDGIFSCHHSVVESLEGGPEEVNEFKFKSSCLKNLKGMPKVKKHIVVVSESLTSLEGAPKEVEGDFSCSYCLSLKSLKGCPEKVRGSFSCNSCTSLTSLKDCPKEVGGDFSCEYCHSLKTLEGCPKEVEGRFNCSFCNSLETLEGCPEKIKGDFYCRFCASLKTLEDCPEEVGGNFYINFNNYLREIDYIPKKIRKKIIDSNH